VKVLISNGESELTTLIKDALSSHNHSVEVANDYDILLSASSHDYDCIIKCYQTLNTVKIGDLTLNCDSFELTCGNKSVRLTNKEFQLLELLMRNPMTLFSTEVLMERFWNWGGNAEINVVWTNIGYLRRKIEELGANVRIKSYRGRGYQIVETK